MFNKDVLMKFIAAQQQKTQPVVSNDGFLNGAPPAGTNYRIPSDTLYNPTPHRIKAVSDNGIETVLEPYDETNVTFPGAQYVDEYELHKAQVGEEVDYLKQEYNPSFNWRNFSNSLNYSRGTDAAPVYGSDLSYARGNADAGFNINREDQETTSYNSRLGYNGRHFNLSGNYGREGENRLRGFNAGANLGRFTGTLIGNQINRDQMTGSTGVEYNDEDHEISAGLSAERNAADHKFAGNFAVKGFSLETRMNKDKSGNAGAGLKTSFGGLTVGGSTSKNADGLHSYGATAKYQNDNGLSLSGQYNLTPLQEDLVRENVSGLANLGKYFISGDASFDNSDTGRWNASAGKRQGDLTFSAGYGNSRGGKESISAGARYGRGWNSVYGSAEYKNNGEDADTLGGKLGFGTKYINGEVEYLPGETPVYKGNLSLNLGPLNIGAKGIYEGDKFKLTPTAGVTYTFDGSEKKYGGLHKFLPAAQEGLQVTAKPNLPDLSKPLSKSAVRVRKDADTDSFLENVAEFADPTGITSWDDAKKAYTEWQRSGEPYPTVDQALSMFGAVPALGKFGKIKYMDPESIKIAYKYIPWQQIVNFFDTSEDIQNDNTSQRVKNMPVRKEGGLHKFLPKAQTGEETGIPADAARYGVNATPKEGAVYVDPDLVNRMNYTQGTINQQSTFGNPREKFEKNVLNAVNNLEAQGFDVSEAGYLPEYLKEGAYYCISGVCYTLNQAGEPVRYYSNSLLQDDVIAGKVPGWKLNYDLGSIKGGDILQFTGNRGQPHHAALVIPNTIKTRENGDINFDVFMNGGDGQMYRENYTINPETDMSDVGQTTQLITRDFGDSMSDAVNIRDWLKNKIEEQDPQFFKKGKQKRRWETYSPGMFNEKGRTYVNMDGESLGYSTPTMMQNTNPDVQKAADLLRKRTLNGGVEYNADFDVDYNTLSKTAGFDQILNRVNDEQFKLDFMKRYNITNREYNAIVSNTFGIYGQESGFGTKKGGLTENDTARGIGRVVLDVASRLKGEGAKQPDIKEDFSRGLTQVKLRNLSKADRKKYGIDADALDNDPEKAFMAAMIVNAQNLPELRRLAAKGETAAVDESNYLDYLPYMYSMPGRLRRGDKKTIQAAIDNGKNPDEMVVQDPNSPLANNQYVQNVRAYANLFEHLPTTSTMEIKEQGGSINHPLQKFVKGGPKRKSVEVPQANYETMNNADQRAEYEAGWRAYAQGAQQWVDMLNREEERRGRELTADEKERFIEKFVKPAEGQRKFNFDRSSDRRFDFLFNDGYTTWNSQQGAPEFVFRKPVEINESVSDLDKQLQKRNSEWLKKEDTGFGRALGFNPKNSAEARGRALSYAKTKVAEELLAKNPQGNRNRVDWLNSFTPEERSIISQSQAAYNFAPDMGTQFRQGAANLFGMDYRDEDLTPEEAKEASRLGVMAPLGYTGNLVKGAISGDFGAAVQGKSAKPMTYGTLESYVQPNSTAALEEMALAGMDPMNVVGIGLLDDAGKAGKVSSGIRGASQSSSGLGRFIPSNVGNRVIDHAAGLTFGAIDVAKGRPFFEAFPVTAAQRQKVWAMQDEAARLGDDFVTQWVYDQNGQIRPEVVDRMYDLDPSRYDKWRYQVDDNSTFGNPDNIFHRAPTMLVNSREKYLENTPRLGHQWKEYIRENRSRIGGVNSSGNTNITLRNYGFYHKTPKEIAQTAAHETGHTFQQLGSRKNGWSNAITKLDESVTPYYFADPDTPAGKEFADAMVEPKEWTEKFKKWDEEFNALHQAKRKENMDLRTLNYNGDITNEEWIDGMAALDKKYGPRMREIYEARVEYAEKNRNKYYTWHASPDEVHSELMTARMRMANHLVKTGKYPDMESAIKYLQNPTDEDIDKMIKIQNLNSFFKKKTSDETKRKLIRMLPAVVPAVGGMMVDDEETAPETFAFGGALSKFVEGGEHGGLDRWFAEKWVDVKTGKECGRQEGEKRKGYPACRPSRRVSEDTPKTASELSSAEKEKFKRTKTSSQRIPYQHKRKEDGGEI